MGDKEVDEDYEKAGNQDVQNQAVVNVFTNRTRKSGVQ